jgi:hypothetical protein
MNGCGAVDDLRTQLDLREAAAEQAWARNIELEAERDEARALLREVLEDGWICRCGCSTDICNRIRAALGGNDV